MASPTVLAVARLRPAQLLRWLLLDELRRSVAGYLCLIIGGALRGLSRERLLRTVWDRRLFAHLLDGIRHVPLWWDLPGC